MPTFEHIYIVPGRSFKAMIIVDIQLLKYKKPVAILVTIAQNTTVFGEFASNEITPPVYIGKLRIPFRRKMCLVNSVDWCNLVCYFSCDLYHYNDVPWVQNRMRIKSPTIRLEPSMRKAFPRDGVIISSSKQHLLDAKRRSFTALFLINAFTLEVVES